jgi:hypothetical protein
VPGQWPIKSVPVSKLRLDLYNVRIPDDRRPDEPAALNYLYLAEDVESLAHDFLRDGYIDNEIPVVVQDGDQFVVLEGNRRVSALKGLLDPALVPIRQAQLRRLLDRYDQAAVPKQVRVMIAPSRDAVNPLLARLHTGSSKKSWPRDQQAMFYFAQLQSGATVDELRKTYSTAPNQLTRFLKMGAILTALRSAKLEPDLATYLREELNPTALEYAYLHSNVQGELALPFDSVGVLTQPLTRDQVAGLSFLLNQVRGGKVDTRSFKRWTSDEWDTFLDGLRLAMGRPRTKPTPTGGTGGTSGTGTGTGAGSGATGGGWSTSGGSTGGSGGSTGAGANSGKTTNPANRRHLSVAGIDIEAQPPGLRRRLLELPKLEVQETPNATFDVLRTILELSVRVYCDKVGDPVPPNQQLDGCLSHLQTKFTDPADRGIRNVISVLKQGKPKDDQSFFLSAEALNSVNHDPKIFVEGQHVHLAWDHMLPLVQRLLA